MSVTYEIRTVRGTPVYAFDNEYRAKEELAKARKRSSPSLRLVKVTKTEEDMPC